MTNEARPGADPRARAGSECRSVAGARLTGATVRTDDGLFIADCGRADEQSGQGR
jgi:hypothetical protein